MHFWLYFFLVVSLVIVRNMMICALHIILGIISIFTWKPCSEKVNTGFSHKLLPPPVLKKCYLHAEILCIQYKTIKACLQNENSALLHIFRHFSNMLQVHSVNIPCSWKTKLFLSLQRACQILAVSIMDKGMSQRHTAGVQSEPWPLPLARAVSDADCKCCPWKWEFFGHWHCGSESLRGPVLVDSLVNNFALQGDVIAKHCL